MRHQDRETVVDMCGEDPSELACAAFYADCEHGILPVTEGHRACLIFNLVLTPGARRPRPHRTTGIWWKGSRMRSDALRCRTLPRSLPGHWSMTTASQACLSKGPLSRNLHSMCISRFG